MGDELNSEKADHDTLVRPREQIGSFKETPEQMYKELQDAISRVDPSVATARHGDPAVVLRLIDDGTFEVTCFSYQLAPIMRNRNSRNWENINPNDTRRIQTILNRIAQDTDGIRTQAPVKTILNIRRPGPAGTNEWTTFRAHFCKTKDDDSTISNQEFVVFLESIDVSIREIIIDAFFRGTNSLKIFSSPINGDRLNEEFEDYRDYIFDLAYQTLRSAFSPQTITLSKFDPTVDTLDQSNPVHQALIGKNTVYLPRVIDEDGFESTEIHIPFSDGKTVLSVVSLTFNYPDALSMYQGHLVSIFKGIVDDSLTTQRSFEVINDTNKKFIDALQNAFHQFKSPLTAIKSSVYLVTRYIQAAMGKIDPNLKPPDEFDSIRTKVSNIEKIVDGIFIQIDNTSLFMQIEAETFEPNFELIEDFRDFTEGVISSIAFNPEEVKINTEKLRGIKIESDPLLLHHILQNIVGNSIKFSQPLRGKETEIDLKTFIVRGDEDEDKLSMIILIDDNGPGVDDNEIGEIFNRDYRSRNTSNISGSGFGLDMTRKMVELLGGEIRALNIRNPSTGETKGLRIAISLPVYSSQQEL